MGNITMDAEPNSEMCFNKAKTTFSAKVLFCLYYNRDQPAKQEYSKNRWITNDSDLLFILRFYDLKMEWSYTWI